MDWKGIYMASALLLGGGSALAQGGSKERPTPPKRDMIGMINDLFHVNKLKLPRVAGKKVYYSFLPVSSDVPGGGIALITSTTAGFYLGESSNTSLSTVTFSPYITFTGRVGYTFRSNIWLNSDAWEIMGDMRFLYYPQYTWGLGGNTPDSRKLEVNYKYARFYQTILKKIKPYFLMGLGYQLDAHFDIDTFHDSSGIASFTGYHYGTSATENSFSSGVTLNLLYDARRNAFNPLPGFYGNIVYRINPGFLGSADRWRSLYIDFRRYISFDHYRQNMLAFWSYYWTTFKSRTPYLDLPSIGWDPYQQRSGRGVPQNRYRGRSLIYLEGEYRRDLTPNGLLGFVLFTNVNAVSEPVTDQYQYLHVAGGGGLRLKFNKRAGTNISLDYGISKQYSLLYLNLGETFWLHGFADSRVFHLPPSIAAAATGQG
jgi:hypothetical protein